MDKMTEKQKKFANYYIETGNAEEAAKKAGYNARGNTTKILQNTTIRKYIDKRITEKDNKRIASQDEVLQYLTSVMRGDIKEEAVVVESIGDFMSEARLIEKQVTPKDRNKAAELLGKRYMLFTDRIEVDGNMVVFKGDDALED